MFKETLGISAILDKFYLSTMKWLRRSMSMFPIKLFFMYNIVGIVKNNVDHFSVFQFNFFFMLAIFIYP